MAVDPHYLISAGDDAGNMVEFILFALFVIASIGSSIVGKLRERDRKKAGTKPVIPPPDRPAMDRPIATRPAIGGPTSPRRPAMARPGRPGPSPAELSARRERARAILLDEPVPQRAPTPQPGSSMSRPSVRGKHPERPTMTPDLQAPDLIGSMQREDDRNPPSAGKPSAMARQTKPMQVSASRSPRIVLSRNTLRDAIVYAEVLGAPRALRDEPRWSCSG